MKFSKDITVNAPADKVWDVFGRDFANIGVWSTAVSFSAANDEIASVNNSPVGGRVCETSFGSVSEEFTAYDDDKKTFSFEGAIQSKMFKNVTNSAALTAKGENATVVELTPEIELTFIGTLMYPMIRMMLSRAIDQILDDLKYYVENGKPSSSKIAAQKNN